MNLEEIKGSKRFSIEHSPTWADVTVKIDFDKQVEWSGQMVKTSHLIKENVEFFANWESDLEEMNGDYLKLFLIKLARLVLILQIEGEWNTVGVIGQFENREGWMPLDGSMGIELMDISELDITNLEDYSITEV